MNKIEKISSVFRWLFFISLILIVIMPFIVWAIGPEKVSQHNLLIQLTYHYLPTSLKIFAPLTLTQKIISLVVSLIPVAIEAMVLIKLIQLFTLYRQSIIFSARNVILIRQISCWIIVGQLIIPFYQALQSIIWTWHNPPGLHMITLTLSGTNIGVFILGIIILFISWIMSEGVRLHEENKQFV